MTGVKICGLTDVEEAELLNQCGAAYAGMVLFYPHSRRNISLEKARDILEALRPDICRVAVTVSPDREQAVLCRDAGFDYLQVHGECRPELLGEGLLPVLQAVNVGDGSGALLEHERIAGYVFDGRRPGSGESFDWRILRDFDRRGKLFMLAGGLRAENVAEGIRMVRPDIVDVSSGVERYDGRGKDAGRIAAFMEAVKRTETEIRAGIEIE